MVPELVPWLVRGARRTAERVLVDFGAQVRIVRQAQKQRHVGKVGEFVSKSGLGDQRKLDEQVTMLDMAKNRLGVVASANAAVHLTGFLPRP